MSLRLFKFEEDNTGLNPNNLVQAEEPTLLKASNSRFIVTEAGPFYTSSLIIVDLVTGKTLSPRLQYTAVQLEEEATLSSGKEVCSIIIIDDNAVSDHVAVTYQAYGGWMSYSVTGIIDMVNALDLDNRPVHWGAIVGKPDRYPPAPHAHPLSDIYGWSKLFPALNAIRDAILTGDEAKFDAIREQFGAEIDRINGLLNKHIADDQNPHKTTKAQVGLGLVENFTVATKAEAESGLRDDVYMTAKNVKQATDALRKQKVFVDTLMIKFQSYMVMKTVRLIFPNPAELEHGDSFSLWKIMDTQPVLDGNGYNIRTVNGTAKEILWDINDDITPVWDKDNNWWVV